MGWSPQKGSLSLSTLRQLHQAEKLRRTGLIEAVYYYERIARRPVPNVQALGARAEALQGYPRVAGSAA